MLDASDLEEQYELEDCIIGRDIVVEIFKLQVMHQERTKSRCADVGIDSVTTSTLTFPS